MGSSLYLQGGAATQNTLKDTLTQVGHGFTVGSAIRYNSVSSQWVSARANNAENAEVVGIVSEVQTSDSFTVVYSGVINIPALAGVSYPALFLSDTVPGGITHNPPSVIGSVVKPVVVRSVSNDGGYVVVNYLGTQIGGSSTVAIDQIQPVGTIMPFAGTAIPDTWLECNAQPVGVTAYPELYDKVLHSVLPRAPIYGHRVNLTGTGLVTANFAVGDIVQFKSTSTNWLGGAYNSNATVLGKIISLTNSSTINAASSMVVETLPIYNSPTKTFYHPNVVFGAGSGAATETAASTGYRVLTTGGVYKSGTPNLVVTTTSIIDFLTPNLQGKFPLGTNDLADADDLTPSGSGFYNAASARTIGDIGGQEETLAGTQVATSTTTGLFATTVSTGLREPNMPPFLTTKYIIKAKPYARAAIIDDVDVDYTRLLVTDLRSGIQRGAGSGEDLVFKTNTSLSTSGTERMRLSNAGNLAIGTASVPTTTRLSIHTASAIDNILRFTNATSGEGPGNGFILGQTSTADCYVWNEETTNILFGTSGNQRMCIHANGNVGIGTNSPGASLDIRGQVFARRFSTSLSGSGVTSAVIGVRNSGDNFEWGHLNSGGEYANVLGCAFGSGQGFIGLHTTHGDNTNTYRTRGFTGWVITNTISATSPQSIFQISAVVNHNANNQSATPYLSILPTGNVGIGTSAPSTKLYVDGTGRFTDTLTLAGATSSALISCATVPTQGQHLTNKTYVDNAALGNVDFVYMGYDGQATPVSKSITLKAGRWLAVANGHCNFKSDANTNDHTTFQTISCPTLSYSSQLRYDKQRTGGAGHGRYTYASSTTAVQITVSTAGTYTFTIGAYNSTGFSGTSRGTTLVLQYMGP